MITKILIGLFFLTFNLSASEQFTPLKSFMGKSKRCLAKATSKSSDCLNCHDGASASVKNISFEPTFQSQSGNINFKVAQGISRGYHAKSHPVGILYIESKAGLKSKGSLLIGRWKDATIVSDLLVDDKVECISCHKTDGGNTTPQLLRRSNTGSELCLSCHNI